MGYVNTENKTVQQVYDELLKELNDRGLVEQVSFSQFVKGAEEYFSISSDVRSLGPDTSFPNYWRLACYVVTGGSEGYYLHVSVIYNDCKHETIFLGKTLHEGEQGKADAWQLAYQIADILGA